MPYYPKSEDWLHKSSLLLQAYPETTRITTRYSLSPARRPSAAARAAQKKATNPAAGVYPALPEPAGEGDDAAAAGTKPPRGHLVLKTFDPVSGVTLKYKTSKAAEVGRLVQMLGVLGRKMGGLPEEEDKEEGGEEEMVGVEATGSAVAGSGGVGVGGEKVGVPGGGDKAGGAGGDKGGKKKKKGKK